MTGHAIAGSRLGFVQERTKALPLTTSKPHSDGSWSPAVPLGPMVTRAS
jgi:hypothetical protein